MTNDEINQKLDEIRALLDGLASGGQQFAEMLRGGIEAAQNAIAEIAEKQRQIENAIRANGADES